MKKGHIYTGIVERVAFPNKGIVRTEEGDMAVVKHAVTGQKVSFSVKKVRKGKGEGRLLEVPRWNWSRRPVHTLGSVGDVHSLILVMKISWN